ncbi:MAG: hypothetical protein JRI25_10125 [Deltaproteobacteria bacterium]|nr:hypothetical protein [Deltaproteobacteria bacterium]
METTLGSAGDFAGAAVWRQTCRELTSAVRIAVLGLEGETASRLARRLRETHPRVAFVVLTLDAEDPEQAASIGMEDAVLSAHASLWATPVTAALGTRERQALQSLERIAPAHRGVVLTDTQLLERISDDPEAEFDRVRARLSAITPEGWPLVAPDELGEWIDVLVQNRGSVTRERRVGVARILLDDARARTDVSLAESEAAVKHSEELLAAEDVVLEDARRRGERIAAHLLASMRTRTEALIVDLRTFLTDLEKDLDAQIAEVPDTATLRRVLPHWLDHVAEDWIGRHLADWRAGVLKDIADVRVDEEQARRAELLPPSLHPAPLRAEAGWGRRLALTTAIGGGAALALFGLWVPGILVASSGIAWSALFRVDASANREKIVDSAKAAVRRMSSDAERLLQEQLVQIEAEVSDLGDRSAEKVERERAEMRNRILEQRAYHRTRSEELRQIRDALAIRVEAIAAESS